MKMKIYFKDKDKIIQAFLNIVLNISIDFFLLHFVQK